jgi:fused signal recognition particle receptor
VFGALKRRLQDAIKKVSKTIAKDEPKEELQKSGQPIEELVDREIDQKIEKLHELEDKIEEDRLPAELRENIAEEKLILEEELEKKPVDIKPEAGLIHREVEEGIPEEKMVPEKKGIFRGLIKRIAEKKLSESEIENVMRELQVALLENDVALEVAEKICSDVKSELINQEVGRSRVEETIKKALHSAVLDVMRQERIDLDDIIKKHGKPYTIVFFGFNGAGKTTTMAKFAHRFSKYRPVLAAGDTFRAASIEQLEMHSKNLGAILIKHGYGADSAAVIFDARRHAEASGSRLVLADTAGRSHSNVNLMDELKKVVRVNNPDLKVLVLDALTGNDIYEQAKLFNDAVGVDAIILTKADVYDKGGAALSAAYTIKKPILYLGVGQEYSDLKEFNPVDIANNLVV